MMILLLILLLRIPILYYMICGVTDQQSVQKYDINSFVKESMLHCNLNNCK